MLRSLQLALLSLLAALAWLPARAAELQWPGRPFQIVASEKTLADLLRELAASQGTTAVVDPKINAVVSGKFDGEPITILESLAATYALSWYYDGAVLYIDPSSDVRSEVMPISASQGEQLIETLRRLRIYDRRYPLLVSAREGTARVSGPRRYVELVRQAVKLVDRRNAANDTSEIRLFPLRYAWAADFEVVRAGREVSIAGVAKVLRSLYGRGSSESIATTAAHAGTGRYGIEAADRQLRLSSGDVVDAPKIDLPSVFTNTVESAGNSAEFNDGELPQFQADTRLNAVLVRDLPERMAQYEKLIAAMDIRPRLVEIEVTIMDVQSDALDKLGVDWRARGDHGDVQIGNGGSPALTWQNGTTERGQTGVDPISGRTVVPVGGVFTASIGHELSEYLIARVTALAQKGEANLIARPKVLTLDNNEAVLENLKEFYISVSGFQDAGLFRVTAGTSVRVTPLIVEESSSQGMMMSINIQDDALSAQSVSSIPIIDRRTVNTQALIAAGTSLLIAGYSSEEKSSAVSGVPVLSDIPGLGRLFKYTRKQQNKQERLYLLSPRLVIPGVAASVTPGTSLPAPVLPAPVPSTPVVPAPAPPAQQPSPAPEAAAAPSTPS